MFQYPLTEEGQKASVLAPKEAFNGPHLRGSTPCPAATRDTVYAISPDSTALEPEIFWQYEFGEEIMHLALAEGVVYVVTDGGILHALK